MGRAFGAIAVMAALTACAPTVWGAEDLRVEDLALCRSSWLDWRKSDTSRALNFEVFVHQGFLHQPGATFYTPRTAMTVAGLKLGRIFPQSVGMGVGFSVVVDSNFEDTKTALERRLGAPLKSCESGEEMQTCELPLADQRTFMIASEATKPTPSAQAETLFGCYYYYEK